MSKFNVRDARVRTGRSPVTTETVSRGRTAEGAPGYRRDHRSELFLLAVSSMFGEDKFYETARTGDDRYVRLVRESAVADPDWTADFLRWLRADANIRTAAIVGAAQYAVARRDAARRDHAQVRASRYTVRQVIDSVLRRADEPGEFVAYWRTNVQRSLPGGVQRGVADAVLRLYDERSYLKWDSNRRGYSFADVLNLTHPGDVSSSAQRIRAEWQHALFAYVTARPHRDVEPHELLEVLRSNARLRAQEDVDAWLNSSTLRTAGMTWEDALSAVGSKVDKRRLWEAIIPSMGYMALLRNLRNFDQAGVSDEVAQRVAECLADPNEVARSRQLPMRFLSAYRAAPSLRWGYALEQALSHSLANIPALPGRTLVLVDTSTSMNAGFSKDGTLMRWDAAVIFGVALAARCAAADVVSFSSTACTWGDLHGAHTKVFPLQGAESLLRAVERWKAGGWFLGGGTATAAALRKHFAGHDRVVVVTDEQAGVDLAEVTEAIPQQVPMYTWNLAGYERGHAPGGTNRHTFGGLTDQAFKMIPLLEAGRDGHWPWESDAATAGDDPWDRTVRSTVPDGYND